jgi:UDP-N-acetylglucosamine--N-acetylmuramyl-(pentapeptide) pyrophosphoryl-undecaprenol N-acetylglucosamine transferase
MTTTAETVPTAAAAPTTPLRVCLAASGGGHLRQLLDLHSVWEKHRHFFITEDTALGRTIAGDHPTHFLPHFAWGQAKQGALLRMLGDAVVSFCKSASIILRERPDVLITTGAGAVYPAVLWARIMGTKIIAMESFARFKQPSLFGRLVAPLSHHFIIPSVGVSRWYPKAEIFDPLVILDTPTPPKEDLIFATVGATLPFDRMVASVTQLKHEGAIAERLVIQTGVGGLTPEGLEVHETLPFGQIESLLKKATVVICHGGTGSIITALREGCHVIAMPRLSELEEHYDDHQSEITDAFEQRGLILVARSTEELREALGRVHERSRIVATTDPVELAEYMGGLLDAYAVVAAKRA